jgi:PBP1b-binding outer membrane lipoprotein LpoB
VGFNRHKIEVGAIFPVVLDGCDSYSFRGKRRLRSVQTTDVKKTADNTVDRKVNASVISQVKPKHFLRILAVISKHKYFGITMRTSDYIEII